MTSSFSIIYPPKIVNHLPILFYTKFDLKWWKGIQMEGIQISMQHSFVCFRIKKIKSLTIACLISIQKDLINIKNGPRNSIFQFLKSWSNHSFEALFNFKKKVILQKKKKKTMSFLPFSKENLLRQLLIAQCSTKSCFFRYRK